MGRWGGGAGVGGSYFAHGTVSTWRIGHVFLEENLIQEQGDTATGRERKRQHERFMDAR